MKRCSAGVDIGGTFTDIVVYDHTSGRQVSRKVLTTHDDPTRAVVAGLIELLTKSGIGTADVQQLMHATTLFTNAVIERRGAPTGLITTEGFRDSLEIGREMRYELYDLSIDKPSPIVPRCWRTEARERCSAAGEVLVTLDKETVDAAAARLVAAGVQSVAIVFLHAYANPSNEAAAARRIKARHPDLYVTTSHEVVREIREFERASTTVINAYVKPLADRYLTELQQRLAAAGIEAKFLMMLSNGGLTHLAEACRSPVQLLESGPAAGALSAAHFGTADSDGRLLAFDMGGTTAKLSLVDDGQPLVSYGFEAARQKRFTEGSGLPVRISTIELIEIGAGGGSIAGVDGLGLLKVGPHSAGSEPGPACYGLGGTEPTVTDADLVLGYLNPDYFAGGTIRVDVERARAAVGNVADRLGVSIERAAWGIHDVVGESMASAARVHIAERGRDPKNYAILCTGGAGPVHAFSVARKVGVRRIICPPAAGVASALGLLVAPASVDRVATLGMRLDRGDWTLLEERFRELEREAMQLIEESGIATDSAKVHRYADGRFVGQGFDLVVPLPPGPYDQGDSSATAARLREAFEAASREKFSRTPPSVPIEFINIRVSVRVAGADSKLALGGGAAKNSPALKGYRDAYFPDAGGYVRTVVLDRNRLAPGDLYDGPAVVEDEGSTLVIGPSCRISISDSMNVIVDFA